MDGAALPCAVVSPFRGYAPDMGTEEVTDSRDERVRRRQRILEAARELFVRQGYDATSLQQVADRAGVTLQAVHLAFSGKRALLKGLIDLALTGDQEPVTTADRPWFRAALAAPTAEAQLRAHVRGTRQILERVAPLARMLHAAMATDPAVASMVRPDHDPRYALQLSAAESLATKPDARPGVSAGQAADVLYGLLSTELYLLFVRRRGWSAAQWEQWVFETLRHQLCRTPEGNTGHGNG